MPDIQIKKSQSLVIIGVSVLSILFIMLYISNNFTKLSPSDNIPSPKISQDTAIEKALDALRRHTNGSLDEPKIFNSYRERVLNEIYKQYISIDQFNSEHKRLQILYLQTNGTLTSIEPIENGTLFKNRCNIKPNSTCGWSPSIIAAIKGKLVY